MMMSKKKYIYIEESSSSSSLKNVIYDARTNITNTIDLWLSLLDNSYIWYSNGFFKHPQLFPDKYYYYGNVRVCITFKRWRTLGIKKEKKKGERERERERDHDINQKTRK